MRTGQRKKPAKSKLFYYSRCEFDSYCLSTQDATFRQYIGAAIIPVVPAVLAVPAFRSFWLSGHSSFSPVIPITAIKRILKSESEPTH
jgi:hypothetical protein